MMIMCSDCGAITFRGEPIEIDLRSLCCGKKTDPVLNSLIMSIETKEEEKVRKLASKEKDNE